eukprot:3397678-Prymnesium_polylepis.1
MAALRLVVLAALAARVRVDDAAAHADPPNRARTMRLCCVHRLCVLLSLLSVSLWLSVQLGSQLR